MTPARILAPSARLTLQDLRVLAADGLVTRVFGDVYVDADADPTPSVRAAAMAAMAEPGDVVGRESAVWVYTGALVSPLMHVLVPGGKRHRRFRQGCCVHESRASGSDITQVAGLRLTTLHRSVFDICAADTECIATVLTALRGHLDLAAFDEYVDGRGSVPGRARIEAAVRVRIRAEGQLPQGNLAGGRLPGGQPPVMR